MPGVFVSGVVNLTTHLPVGSFPMGYEPVRYPRHGVHLSVSGVGWNHARALTILGSPARLGTFIGNDLAGLALRAELEQVGLMSDTVLTAEATPQAVVLYDTDGRRQVHTDLKDLPDMAYPVDRFESAVRGCDTAVLTNIGFSRLLLTPARRLGLRVVTDVQAVADIDDPYNREFMAAADVLFASDERLFCSPEQWAAQALDRYPCRIVVIGMGSRGCLLAVRDQKPVQVPAVAPRGVVSTVGAGDALLACFVHVLRRTDDPHLAARRAVLFAGWKIGEAVGGRGYLTGAQLEELAQRQASRS